MINKPHKTLLFLLALMFSCNAFSQWTPVNTPSDENVFALQRLPNNWLIVQGGQYRSTDNGLSWEPFAPNWAHKSNMQAIGDTLVAIYTASYHYELMWSLNAGSTWNNVALPLVYLQSTNYHTDVIAHKGYFFIADHDKIYRRTYTDNTLSIVYDPSQTMYPDMEANDDYIWLGTYKGLFKSGDTGATWVTINSDWDVDKILVKGDSIFVKTVDNSYHSLDGGLTWQTLNHSFTKDDKFYFQDGKLYYAAADHLYVSDDFGITWDLFFEANMWIVSGFIKEGNFILMSAGSLYRSNDNGANWTTYTAQLTAPDDYFYVSTFENNLFNRRLASTDGGQTWANKPNKPGVPYGDFRSTIKKNGIYYSLLYFSQYGFVKSEGDMFHWENMPTNTMPPSCKKLQLAGGHFFLMNGNDLYRSSDDGITWNVLNVPDLNYYLNDFISHNDTLFVATGKRILRSVDFGNTWQIMIQNPTISFVWDFLLQVGDRIYAGHNGVGIYESKNGGQNWQLITQEFNDPVNGFSASEMVSNQFGLLMLYKSKLYFYPANYNTWFSLEQGIPSPNYSCGGIAVADDAFYGFIADPDLSAGHKFWRISANNFMIASASGKVFLDENGNDTFDVNELGIPDLVVKSKLANTVSNTDSLGNYLVYTNIDNDTVFVTPSLPYTIVTPPYYVVDSTQAGQNFAVHFIPDIKDLCITHTNFVFRPGFHEQGYLKLNNVGTTNQPCTVKLIVDVKLDSVLANPAPSEISGDTLTWHFANLAMHQDSVIWLEYYVPATLALGETIQNQASIDPVTIDANPANNQHSPSYIVVGSYDPNDKKSDPKQLTPSQVAAGDSIVFTVRFQNMGTYPASFVTITDTLSQLLDASTFRVVANSHPLTWTIRENGIVKFRFDDINLPDSITDALGSHGFVQYTVKPKADLHVGDIIENTAHIYFDYNPPITTNTVKLPIILLDDLDSDGIPDSDEDTNGDGNLSNDDTDFDGLPDYLDPDPFVFLKIKAFLQGPYIPNQGMMHDSLRIAGLLPLIEPYSSLSVAGQNPFHHIGGGGETIASARLQVSGDNALVDWVFLELRSTTNPSAVVLTKSALIQRDGNVTDLDGNSSLYFKTQPGSYFLSIRHRNHLGVMTAVPLSLDRSKANASLLDFSYPATATYGTFARKPMGNKMVLWGGNANADQYLIYQGAGADRDMVFFDVALAPGNANISLNYIAKGYSTSDTNMDGKMIFVGLNNDVDQLTFFNVLHFPTNINFSLNFYMTQQLP